MTPLLGQNGTGMGRDGRRGEPFSLHTGSGDAIDFKRGQDDARDVLLLRSDFERSRFGLLMHKICDVAGGVRDLGEGERRELHHPSHLPLRLFFPRDVLLH